MSIVVTAIPNGKWKQNCYVISADTLKSALLIDPGSDAPLIEAQLEQRGLTPVAILNTHAHYDHIGAVAPLMTKYRIPFYLHYGDLKLLKQANLYKLLFDSRESVVVPEPTHELKPLVTRVQIDDFHVQVLFTPGHTKGSCCLQIDNNLFSGDTLLSNGPGRTDLPGGDKAALAQSIQLLQTLPEDITVWPGHGRSFSLGSVWDRQVSAGVGN